MPLVKFLLLGIFLPIIQSFPSSEGRPKLLWVATDIAQCSNHSNKTDCDTLEHYLQRKDINFSLSDTTWIFLHGEHVLSTPLKLDIVGARNVTFKGEDKCVMKVKECVLVLTNISINTTKYDPYFKVFVKTSSHIKFKQLKVVAGYNMARSYGVVHIFVTESSHVTFEHFKLETVKDRYNHRSSMMSIESKFHVEESSHVTIEQFKATFYLKITVTQTNNLCVRSVDFRNVFLYIGNPIGDFIIVDSILKRIIADFIACPYKPAVAEQCSCNFICEHCRIGVTDDGITFRTDQSNMAWQQSYHSVKIKIVNSTFLSRNDLRITIGDYSIRSYTVEVNNVTFKSSSIKLELPLLQSATFTDQTIDGWLLAHAYVVINECSFVEAEGAIMITLRGSNCKDFGKVTRKHPEILISHTNFVDGQLTLEHPNSLFVEIIDSIHDVHTDKHGNLLTIQRNSFKRAAMNWLTTKYNKGSIFAALALRNLQGYRVVLAGDNLIADNQGYGLMLENTQIELHNYNEVTQNRFEQGQLRTWGGGIFMSSGSQLLLTPGTLLNVSSNTGHPHGGGIFISHMAEFQRYGMFLTSFLDCYFESFTCPGWCFFQFINSDGQYVNASDIAEHNATVILSHNTATLGGNNVFNGHFQNCSLQTAQDTSPASRECILSVFHQNPSVDKEMIPSYPYVICLCDGDELNCIRKHTFVINTYPVQQFSISLFVMGDWQCLLSVNINVVVKGEIRSHQMDVNCTKVYTLENPAPGTSHYLSLEASIAGDEPILVRNLTIQVFNSCSPGLIYEGHKCACNALLKQHMFTCTIRTNTTTYRTELSHYWIGMKGEQLLISPNCLASFCNSAVLLGGLALNDSTRNQQCRNGRQGLLCSECPSGYSSVIGSFKCKQCSSVWLLQLPLYAFGGIFIVALLFLFNLTLLQGTIMGVVLYANIMGLMTAFLQEHAGSPIFFLLSVLNLQSGAGVCFYDGMDEFSKALLQFAFPFYLFTLLVVIIIVTHKCGYRMFRKARFIARRAVPVLATIMLITYTSLMNAVIAPLRYTTLYNADTTQGETVWLYQPSLPFFGGQHLVLGILSIAVTVLYLIPFTFTMLFGDLMRRYFRKLWFSHFMDVLHGAFRWPLGFWIGLRLLVRVILVVINISTNPNTSAFCTLVTAGTLLVVQLLVKPFRDPNQFREDIHVQSPPSCKRKCLTWIKKFLNMYHAPLFDTLYLLNIALTSAMVSFGSNSQMVMLSVAGVNTLILLALVQFAVILVYHAYNFFPLPERARSCAQSCWSTMWVIPSMLKDTQCCRIGPREEEELRRSPIPILILRPPEIDESYDTESETSSYNEQFPPEDIEMRDPLEPLQANGN